MRWPLRHQILIRMLLLLLSAIFAVTWANIRSTIAANRQTEKTRLARISDMVANTRFPLSSAVLENMSLLSGAEFLLRDESGQVVEKTRSAPAIALETNMQSNSNELIIANEQTYTHELVRTTARRNRNENVETLHIFVPKQSAAEIWWRAGRTPISIALLAIPITFLISWALANQVTRPLGNLGSQVKQIAGGDLRQVPQTANNDEVRDLGDTINELAEQLADYEQRLRKNERLKNVVQFGNSIAHHLRNMSTGCKLAIELLAERDPMIREAENFQVASRQLELMDSYIERFLMLSKSQDQSIATHPVSLELTSVLNSTVALLRPNATHLDVDLNVNFDADGSLVVMPREDAEQLMMNLISNAIAAAAQRSVTKPVQPPKVEVNLRVSEGRFLFSVADNGDGPPESIAQSLFQPFVTGKSEGTGLGLFVVKDIADRQGGQVNWNRQQGTTIFTFDSSRTA